MRPPLVAVPRWLFAGDSLRPDEPAMPVEAATGAALGTAGAATGSWPAAHRGRCRRNPSISSVDSRHDYFLFSHHRLCLHTFQPLTGRLRDPATSRGRCAARTRVEAL
jgi:hypothetical protein